MSGAEETGSYSGVRLRGADNDGGRGDDDDDEAWRAVWVARCVVQ